LHINESTYIDINRQRASARSGGPSPTRLGD
jgi:hypothetical protein